MRAREIRKKERFYKRKRMERLRARGIFPAQFFVPISAMDRIRELAASSGKSVSVYMEEFFAKTFSAPIAPNPAPRLIETPPEYGHQKQ